MVARIYKPAKTSMQSGTSKTKNWVLDYEPQSARTVDPLMGWTSSSDMNSQVRLTFANSEEAEDYAKRHGIKYEITQPKVRVPKPKAYSDNFRYDRQQPWTH